MLPLLSQPPLHAMQNPILIRMLDLHCRQCLNGLLGEAFEDFQESAYLRAQAFLSTRLEEVCGFIPLALGFTFSMVYGPVLRVKYKSIADS